MMRPEQGDGATLEVVSALRSELDAVTFPFPSIASAEARLAQDQLRYYLDHELLPRLRQVGEPKVIGVAGPTGTGKSVVANTLAGQDLATVSALRPTTAQPQILVRPSTAALMAGHPALTQSALCLGDEVLPGRAVLDLSDPFAAGNPDNLDQVELPVDCWIVVASGLRYGDALVWDLLGAIMPAQVPTLFLINRLPRESVDVVVADAKQMLADRGWPDLPVMTVLRAKGPVTALDTVAAEPIQSWLAEQGLDPWPQAVDNVSSIHESVVRALDKTKRLVRAEKVHQATLDLLRQATDEATAEVVNQAAQALRAAVDAGGAATSAALAATAPKAALGAGNGPTANADAIEPEAQLRLIWESETEGLIAFIDQHKELAPHAAVAEKVRLALDRLEQPLAQAVKQVADQVTRRARRRVVGLWQSGQVPEGTRALAQPGGLLRPDDGPSQASKTSHPRHWLRLRPGDNDPHLLWRRHLASRLAETGDETIVLATKALTKDGMARLVQAVALGADNAAVYLEALAPDRVNDLVRLGLEAQARALAGAVDLDLALFGEAIETATAQPTGLSGLARRLSLCAKTVDAIPEVVATTP